MTAETDRVYCPLSSSHQDRRACQGCQAEHWDECRGPETTSEGRGPCEMTEGCTRVAVHQYQCGWDTDTNRGVYAFACEVCYEQYLDEDHLSYYESEDGDLIASFD